MPTCVRPPVHAVRQPTSLCFSCLEGLSRASTASSSAPQVHLKAQGGLAQEKACCGGGDTPPPPPASHRRHPCPRRGPEPCPVGAARDAKRAGSGLLDPVPKCPTGLWGRVTWSPQTDMTSSFHVSGQRAGAIWEKCSGHVQGWACGQGSLQWREPEGPWPT